MRNSRNALAKDAADKLGILAEAVTESGPDAATPSQRAALQSIANEAIADAYAAGATADDINRHQQ